MADPATRVPGPEQTAGKVGRDPPDRKGLRWEVGAGAEQ